MATSWLKLGLVGGLTLGVVVAHQYVFAGLLMVSGRSPHCDFGKAAGSIGMSQRQAASAERVTAASRKITTDGDLEQWDTPMGPFWLPPKSLKEVLYDIGEQERGIYEQNGRGLKAGDVVLDCGANVGVYTRKALNKGASKVVAVEPSPENLNCLRKNFAKEIAEGRVVIYPKGVWDKDDVLTFFVNPTNTAGNSFVRQLPGTTETIQAPLTTIDKLVEELKLDRVDYIKFDIEGAERRALAGGKQTLAKFHPRMAVCVYHLPDDPVVIPQVIRAAWNGYKEECGACLVTEGHVTPEVFFYF